MKERLKAFWKRVSNRDRLSYTLVIAFGLSLLGISIFFSLGYQYGRVIVDRETGEFILLVIDEPNVGIRVLEMAMAVGMIVLGFERMRNYKRRFN